MNNKNVLIIGALGGIGSAATKEFIAKGYNVFGLDICESSNIDSLHYYQCDITKEENILNCYELISREIDELYAIVHVAGVFVFDSLLEISEEKFKKILDINFLGITRINRIFFPLLKKGSRILITSSETAPLDPLPFEGIYGMVKSLVEKYAFSLRMEVNMFGIKVIVLRPGAINTNMLPESTKQIENFCEKTKIHKASSQNFLKITNKVETKHIQPDKLGKFIVKIVGKKRPKYTYRTNNNVLLKILNFLPDKLQTAIITKIIKDKTKNNKY